MPTTTVAGVTLRLAAYAVCVENDRILLALSVPSQGATIWTLPGGRVEPGEDPFDAVIREVGEETGCVGIVDQLIGVDSRVVPLAERLSPGTTDLHSVGIFYRVQIVGGELRPEPNGDTAESVWTPIPEVAGLRRASLVDVGLALVRDSPATGHVDGVSVAGLIQH